MNSRILRTIEYNGPMNFLAIDIETTGLNPMKHGITEFAAVFTNLAGTEQPLTFYRYINPEDFVWSQYCMRLHDHWLRRLLQARESGKWECDGIPIVPDMKALIDQFMTWLYTECSWPLPDQNGKIKSITAAGKNFGSFDRQFLDTVGFPPIFKHRSLDPGMLYILPTDTEPPDLLACKNRAIGEGAVFKNPHVAHNALEDAQDVVALLQHRYKKR